MAVPLVVSGVETTVSVHGGNSLQHPQPFPSTYFHCSPTSVELRRRCRTGSPWTKLRFHSFDRMRPLPKHGLGRAPHVSMRSHEVGSSWLVHGDSKMLHSDSNVYVLAQSISGVQDGEDGSVLLAPGTPSWLLLTRKHIEHIRK